LAYSGIKYPDDVQTDFNVVRRPYWMGGDKTTQAGAGAGEEGKEVTMSDAVLPPPPLTSREDSAMSDALPSPPPLPPKSLRGGRDE
jgi:hypothetical protein